MPAVARPGTDSGSVIRRKAPIGASPSTCPPSSSSIGRESKKDIMRYTIRGNATNIWDRISTPKPPTSRRLAKMKYHGTSRLTPGMIRAMRTTIADRCMVNLLIAYAAGTLRINENTVDHKATEKLLKMKTK